MSGLGNANHRTKVIKALGRAGFEAAEGGNHTIMHHPDGRYTVIPRQSRVKPNLLRAILKQCGLSEAEFLRLYRKRSRKG